MFKVLTAVMFTLSISSAWAFDINQLDPNYSVKNIIKAKLWYEGINVKSEANTGSKLTAKAAPAMPEELSIALDKIDS